MTKKYHYLLKSGRHSQGGRINAQGKRVEEEHYTKGDEFESDVDLIALFGPASLAKFQPLGETAVEVEARQLKASRDAKAKQRAADARQPKPKQKPEPEEPEDELEEEVLGDEGLDLQEDGEDEDGLEQMTVPQLREHAEELGIDLGNAKRKSDIIDLIRDDLAAEEE